MLKKIYQIKICTYKKSATAQIRTLTHIKKCGSTIKNSFRRDCSFLYDILIENVVVNTGVAGSSISPDAVDEIGIYAELNDKIM